MKSTTKASPPDLVFAEGATGSFGDVEIPDEAFEPKNLRVRISMMVPSDVLALLRAQAKKKGKPYQTLANDILRDAVMGAGDPTLSAMAERLTRVEQMLATVASPARARKAIAK